MTRNNYSVGLLLIGIAVILLLGKLGVFSFLGGLLWPVFILLPGVVFHFLYFSRVLPAGVLVPGGILVTYSLMFFFCNIFGWGAMSYLWPGFIFGVAVGLYELHLFDRHAGKGVFTAAMILALLSAVFFALAFMFTAGIYFIIFVLIVVGVGLIMTRKRSW
ncbi:hypothetical protein [Paenibacillus sp. YN15]|uniref:hypothetical protein n=1 Tax=Paenibacillus sp. YN15 TaxID=1742774 RepID=UPI000DCDE129|nr:hypothetical protein [Paenibacillus sp. YN15]RAU99210.1 hypothetical protein DQG13_16295 [Paenibacillus sp. YN15]